MSIEAHFDIAFVAAMARREKQIQQNYRPIIAVHKWFARRPGTLFRGLTLAEFGERPLCGASDPDVSPVNTMAYGVWPVSFPRILLQPTVDHDALYKIAPVERAGAGG